MRGTTRDQLAKALEEGVLIRFSRRFEDHRIRGYVLDIGPQFFLLALVSDRIWFDGYECFRIRDVGDVRPDDYAEFVEAALKQRGERIPETPLLNVNEIGELLLTANRAFPLVSIHQEEMNPHVCHIGRVTGVTQDFVDLLEIEPGATWETNPTPYRLGDITRVNFGGDYEEALHLVGGIPESGRP